MLTWALRAVASETKRYVTYSLTEQFSLESRSNFLESVRTMSVTAPWVRSQGSGAL